MAIRITRVSRHSIRDIEFVEIETESESGNDVQSIEYTEDLTEADIIDAVRALSEDGEVVLETSLSGVLD